jgi:pimeloyl-ACP methyl ester carboxylesterase
MIRLPIQFEKQGRYNMQSPEFVPILHHQIAVYQSQGTGPTVFLLHGNSTSSRIFQKQFDGPLGQKYHLVAFDYPGHGQSSNAADCADYSMPGFADVLVELVRLRGLEASVFAGFSLGGHVVLEASDRLPQAHGFMIYGAPPVGKPPAMDRAFQPHESMGLLFKGELTPKEAEILESGSFTPGIPAPAQFVEDCLRTDPNWRGSFGQSVGLGRYRDEIEIVGSLQQPLAVLHGKNEQLVSLDYIRGLTIPTLWRGQVQVIPGAGHALHWEAPEAFALLVEAFIAG